MNEVILYTYGDSSDATTWSNVPYCFSKSMEKKGIVVRRVNLEPKRWARGLWKLLVEIPLKLIYPDLEYQFIRSSIFHIYANHLIKKSVNRYRDAQYCIFLMYDFYNKYSQIPSLLFSDWTYKILLEDRIGRKPYLIEKSFIKLQDKAIKNANHIVCLFPAAADSMRKAYPGVTVNWRKNVINNLFSETEVSDSMIVQKRSSNRVLFIGNRKYKNSALLLIDTIEYLCTINKDVELHIIGMTKEELAVKASLQDRVHCYGYLNKSNPDECSLYYDLLIHSKVFCNPTPKWAGYSSMVEAMYFYTPAIVSPNKDLLEEFGENCPYLVYNQEHTKESLAKNLLSILESVDYDNLSLSAHERVKNYTWNEYVDWILNIIQ